MANENWHDKGHDYAYNWKRGNMLPVFPSEKEKEEFTEGYCTGWWERGNDDARSGRSHLTDFPNRTAAVHYHDGWEDEFC
jgi:hypothetical protein